MHAKIHECQWWIIFCNSSRSSDWSLNDLHTANLSNNYRILYKTIMIILVLDISHIIHPNIRHAALVIIFIKQQLEVRRKNFETQSNLPCFMCPIVFGGGWVSVTMGYWQRVTVGIWKWRLPKTQRWPISNARRFHRSRELLPTWPLVLFIPKSSYSALHSFWTERFIWGQHACHNASHEQTPYISQNSLMS